MAFEITTAKEYIALIRRSNTSGDVGGRKWSGSWVEEPRLIPKNYTKFNYGLGNASFELIPTVYNRGAGWETGNDIDSGSYVAIATRNADLSYNIIWVGYIVSMPSIRYKSKSYTSGMVSASRIGAMLDQIPLRKFLIKKSLEGTDTIAYIAKPPQANYATQSGEVIGNKVAHPDGAAYPPVFANDILDCGKLDANYWTRDELVKHILAYSLPNGMAPITLNYNGGATTVAQDIIKESYLLEDVSLKGALDLLLNRQRGLIWDIDANGDDWILNVRLSYDSSFNTSLDLAQISRDYVTELSISESSGAQYDEIIVEGHPIVWMGTIENGTADEVGTPKYFKKGWTSTQETAYMAASDIERKNANYDDVFRKFTLLDPFAGDQIYTQHATNGQGTPALFCQHIVWNGSDVEVINTLDTAPYMPTASLSRVLPWATGFDKDSDTRETEQKNAVNYEQPLIFVNKSTASVDVTKTTEAGENWYMDDRGLNIRLRAAYGHKYAAEEDDGSFSSSESASHSWQSLAFTVAIESVQTLKISAYRNADVINNPIRKTLVIKGDWHAWACHQGAIVSIDSNGDPERTVSNGAYAVKELEAGSTFLLRNDFPAAADALAEAQVWAFRESKSGSITFTDPSIESLFQVGESLLEIVDTDDNSNDIGLFGRPSVTHQIKSAIESISVNLDINGAPSITIGFGIPETPSRTGSTPTVFRNASQASIERQTVYDLQKIRKELQGIPVQFSKGGASALQEVYEIIEGQPLPPANITGIKYESTPVTLVDDDPEVAGTRGDGMGIAQGLRSGEKIMVVHDSNAPYGVQVALRLGDYGVSIATATSSGGTVYHYLARF